jgi:hypothetical protein
MKKIIQPLDEKQIAFEKTRFEYCVKIYDRELERKDNLEKRAQFYLSIVTLILGGVFFNIDFFNTIGNLIASNSSNSSIVSLVYFFLGITIIALIVSIIGILQTMEVKRYKTAYPARIISSLFSPNSTYFEKESETDFLRATAMSYAIVLETNRKINDSKTIWIRATSFGIFTVVISFAAIVSLVAYLLLQS